jgi:tRNA 5-methylaminomethyl-2-thiouridine biosynthesis bifunctional protein
MVTRAPVKIVSVAVIGAGLAGAACARALSLQGFRVVLFEGQAGPATAASGNPIGILHPLISADHNLASQWVEAGLVTTLRWLEELRDWTATPPSAARGDDVIARPHGQNVIARPHGQNVIARARRARGNLRSETIGEQCPVLQLSPDCGELVCWTTQGAWIRPAKFVRACLAQAQAKAAQLVFGKPVSAIIENPQQQFVELHFSDNSTQAFDAVVVASGQGVSNLLPHHELRLNAIRGTVTSYQIPEDHSLPCIICANGYATPVIDGEMVVGASYERIDDQGNVHADPVSNLERLANISPALAALCLNAPGIDRTSIRTATLDRMPHIGRALNTQAALTPGMSQLHHMPRSDRLWILAGLGSRGLSFAPLAAEVISQQMAGQSPSLGQRLLDCADPVRFALRRHQRRAVEPRSC